MNHEMKIFAKLMIKDMIIKNDDSKSKAELLHLKPHPFISKKVGNQKKVNPLLLYQFYKLNTRWS